MKYAKKPLIACLIIGIVFMIVKYFNLTDFLTIQFLHSNMYAMQQLVHEHYLVSVFFYMLSFILASTFSVPGSSIFTTAAGLLFGWSGLVYALLAATVGATFLFLASRYFIGSFVQQRYAEALTGFNNEIHHYGHYYLLVIRLLAILPFCLVNTLAGLTLFSIYRFIGMTFFGLIPVSVVYIFAGIQLGKIASPHDFFSPKVMIAFSVFILFKVALVPAVIKIVKRLFTLLRAKNERNVTTLLDKVNSIPYKPRMSYKKVEGS